MSRFTNAEKAAEAERETQMRKSVYARRLSPGERMRPIDERRIHIMSEIASDYRALAEKEEPSLL